MSELDPRVLQEMRDRARRVWAAGHYPTIAARLEEASWELADAAQVFAGDEVLDVGSGSGNTAVALAQRGGTVVGIDQTDAWFDDARAKAEAARVEVDLRVADAEELPFEDASFDVVASCFAHIFAPRHDIVAAEMSRVLRVGGTLAVAVWDQRPDPAFDVLSDFLPPPPEGVQTPYAWGDPDYLRAKFRPHGIRFDRADVFDMVWDFGSPDEMIDWLFAASGPWIASRDALVEAGRWDEALAAMRAGIEEHDLREDGTVRHEMRYLIATGTRRDG